MTIDKPIDIDVIIAKSGFKFDNLSSLFGNESINSEAISLAKHLSVCTTDMSNPEAPAHNFTYKLVLDAVNGFIPLLEPGNILRWRFNSDDLRRFHEPKRVAAEVRKLFSLSIQLWGDSSHSPLKRRW